MSDLHWFLAILSALVWIGIIVGYYWDRIVESAINRFGRRPQPEITPEREAELRAPIFERGEDG